MSKNIELEKLVSRALNDRLENPYAKVRVVKHLGTHDLETLLGSVLMEDYDERIKFIILDQLELNYSAIGVKRQLMTIITSEEEERTVRERAAMIFKNSYGEDISVDISKIEL